MLLFTLFTGIHREVQPAQQTDNRHRGAVVVAVGPVVRGRLRLQDDERLVPRPGHDQASLARHQPVRQRQDDPAAPGRVRAAADPLQQLARNHPHARRTLLRRYRLAQDQSRHHQLPQAS